jgi:hypothetical protein
LSAGRQLSWDGELHTYATLFGVTDRFVKNCTLRRGRGLCKGGPEWSRFPISQAAIAAPVVVAGQVGVFPFQPKLHGYSKPIAVSPMPGDKVAIGRRKGIELPQAHKDCSASLIIALAARWKEVPVGH